MPESYNALKIDKLVNYITKIKKERDEQIARGLNNFNPLMIVRNAREEVGLHSKFIYELINPNGSHFQGKLFLNHFIEIVLSQIDDIKNKIEGEIQVQREDAKDKNDNRRIDFTIRTQKLLIGIEMKIYAEDQKNQIQDYYDRLIEEAKRKKELGDENPEVFVFYLTLDGKAPSKKSLGKYPLNDSHIKLISFKNEMLKWINVCQKEVRNITNLNQALEDYKHIIERLTGSYKGEVVNIVNEIAENEEMLQTVLELDKNMNALKAKALKNFFDQIDEVLQKKDFILVNDLMEISDNRDFILTEKTCKDYYKVQRNRPESFGYFYEKETLPENTLLFVMVASKFLHYGLVKIEKDSDERNKVVKMDCTQAEGCVYKSFEFLECRDWKRKSFSWCSSTTFDEQEEFNVLKNPEKLTKTKAEKVAIYIAEKMK